MNNSLLVIIAVAIVGIAGALVVSPYFTESSVNEALPTGAIISPKMEDKKSMTDEEKSMTDEEKIFTKSFSGTFVGAGDGIHDAQGNAYTITLEDGTEVLRLENFKSTNGPDLYVYLATDDKASDFVSLGMLKASSGNQNYDIPADTDISKYNNVLIWCKSFGVLFGSSDLSSS
ncbi:MAG: hypothetical protein GKS07_08135 [Nitrosopumilus sp.]|nr:MAG: hypothetical protein GKS07_08135 [Nitrosopumilus sp.]